MLNLKRYEDDHAEGRELYAAVAIDKSQYLNELLSQDLYKKSINSRCGWGNSVTPLHLAASLGSLQCLRILLANGAEVDSLDAKAQTPLFSAVHAGHFDGVKELLKAGANPSGSPYNNSTPVLMASRDGKNSILKKLLEYRAAANVRTKISICNSPKAVSTGPLYLSALYEHLECFRTLLLYGADPDYNCMDNKFMKQSSSVIEFCLLHHCKTAFVKLLIDFGANIYLPGIDSVFGRSYLNKETEEFILRERGLVRSLKSQARLTIWKVLRDLGRMQLIDQLEVPPMIMRYLCPQFF
ncbi:Ankyrin repeat and SOCS box 12 [Pelobates cultripes]|uniref:Ankyrin repeat and SOCS box 12 n=1 Tax=Pelobates cultripes TaxID=61616 RepID=A0AAD1SZP2_PELCU|nr:Ankyrin repeat and SOCS box 12 [Pelobates cultripes]